MKKAGQSLLRVVYHLAIAIVVFRIIRLFQGKRLSFFPIAIIIAAVFFIFASGLMKIMFAGADDKLPGEIPAGRSEEIPDEEYEADEEDEEYESWDEGGENTASIVKLVLPAGRATVTHLKNTPLSQMGIDLENFCLLFNEASKHMQGDVQTDVAFEGGSYQIKINPQPINKPHSEPTKTDYKKIASEIGTEAELRELERREREEFKRLSKGG